MKIVDANEVTVSIDQEIYDENDRLVGRHRKYPEDSGHQELTVEEDRLE